MLFFDDPRPGAPCRFGDLSSIKHRDRIKEPRKDNETKREATARIEAETLFFDDLRPGVPCRFGDLSSIKHINVTQGPRSISTVQLSGSRAVLRWMRPHGARPPLCEWGGLNAD